MPHPPPPWPPCRRARCMRLAGGAPRASTADLMRFPLDPPLLARFNPFLSEGARERLLAACRLWLQVGFRTRAALPERYVRRLLWRVTCQARTSFFGGGDWSCPSHVGGPGTVLVSGDQLTCSILGFFTSIGFSQGASIPGLQAPFALPFSAAHPCNRNHPPTAAPSSSAC
jgi:hypothetical protein